MNREKTNSQNERIKIGFDYYGMKKQEANIEEVCEYINNILIPFLEKEKIEYTEKTLLKFAQNEEEIVKIYISKKLKNENIGSKYLKDFVESKIRDEIEVLLEESQISTIYIADEKLILFENNQAKPDLNALEECYTAYLPNEWKDAYKRHQEAVKALNEFFKGSAPDAFSLCRFFPCVDGIVKQSKSFIDYSKFV